MYGYVQNTCANKFQHSNILAVHFVTADIFAMKYFYPKFGIKIKIWICYIVISAKKNIGSKKLANQPFPNSL